MTFLLGLTDLIAKKIVRRWKKIEENSFIKLFSSAEKYVAKEFCLRVIILFSLFSIFEIMSNDVK